MTARFHGVRRSPHRAALILLISGWLGCIVGDERCDENQIEIQGSYRFCACRPGTVPSAGGIGCERCGKNEEVQEEACVCSSGYARTSADAPCEKSTIGRACEDDESCSESFPHCAATPTGDGYCTTTGCSANADCAAGWSCELDAGTRFCKRPPTGQGAHCDTSADCASYEATFCEALQSHTCLLEMCATGTNTCPSEWSCCDLTSLIGASLCVPPDRLLDGACPAGGKLVSP
jgi:hypothetical protein